MEKIIFCIILIVFTYKMNRNFISLADVNKRDEVRKQYTVLLSFILILISGLRNLAVGDDTYNYFLSYEELYNSSIKDIIEDFKDSYTYGLGKDPGYSLLGKVFQTLIPFFRPFLLLIQTSFYAGMGYMIYKNTTSIYQEFIAFLVFTILFMGFSYTGCRQVLVLGATMYSMELIKQKKLLKFLLLILVLSTIHKSVLVFLPFYFIAHFKHSHLLLILTLCILPFLFANAGLIILLMAETSQVEQYEAYVNGYAGAGTPIFTSLVIAIGIFYLFRRKQLKKIYPNQHIFGNALVMTIGLTPLTWIDPTMMRLLMYFSTFIPVLLALSIDSIQDLRIKNLLIKGVTIISLAM